MKTLIVDRDTFFEIKSKQYKTTSDHLKLLINSFGNDRKTYLYNKDIGYEKYVLGKAIIDKYDIFSGYNKTDLFKNRKIETNQLEQLTRLVQLERLAQLERFQKLDYCPITYSEDYNYFSDVTNSILYLDPPYENSDTTKYNESINHKEFYEWAFQMSKNNIVIISSYEVSDKRLECVYEFKTARSSLSGGMAGKRTEKLFMFKESN